MFALFAGDTYYPGGGWYDLVGTYDSLAAAQSAAAHGWPDRYEENAVNPYDWYHIIDLTTQKMILQE